MSVAGKPSMKQVERLLAKKEAKELNPNNIITSEGSDARLPSISR